MQNPGKIEDMKKKIHARARDALALAWDRQLCLGQWQWRRRGCRQLQEIQWGKMVNRRTNETPQGTWLGRARKGSLWLCYTGPLAEKRKSGISGKRRRSKPIPWEKNSWEVRRRKRASDRAKKRVYTFRVIFGRERRASRLPSFSLGLGDDRRSTSGSGDVSLAIFITSVSGSESLASFTNRIFLFSGPPGLRMAFDVAEKNERFGRIQCQRSEESRSRGKRKKRVFLCRRTVRVKVESKVIPASFRKIEERGTFVGAKHRRERD